MDALSDFADLLDSARSLLAEPATWWQLAVVAGSLLVAWLTGQFLQRRLQPVVQPGGIQGVPRTAVRTGYTALIPLLWWLLLVAAKIWAHRHGWSSDILQAAIALVGALTVIRMGVFALRHAFSPGSKLKAWEWSLTVTIWGLVALHMLGLLPFVIDALDEYAVMLGKTRVSVYTVVSFVLSMALLSLVALWLSNGIQAVLRRTDALDTSIKLVLGKLTRFLLLTLAIVVAMITAGIDLTALAVFGGALGVGLGLGLQRIVSNFVSGIVLAFEESIRVGDVLSIGGTFGTVQALHARHIVVRDNDGRDILIPNETLMTSEIMSWTYGDRKVRLRLPVQVSYQDDPERAMALMVQAARVTPRVLTDPEPIAELLGFADNGINLELRLWIHDPEGGINNVRSDVNVRIWRTFRDAGISIPFPQRDLHITEYRPAPAAFPFAGTPGSRPGSGHDQTPAAPGDDRG